jgi:putative tryptophan/tyrosine transport system substrate-binding protein
MDRRTFIGTLTGSLLVASLAVEAQQAGKVYRIGFLLLSPRDVQRYLIAAFEAGLREKGYTLGREVVIEYRSADGHSDQLPILAAELVRLGVDVIVTGVNPNTVAAKRATSTIPIVMASSFFPVEDGLVASLARPGGNVTGLTQEAGEEVAKRLQLLREVVPKLTRVATLSGVGMTYNRYFVKRLQDASLGLGVSILPFEFQGADDGGKVFFEIEHARADGLIVFGGPITVGQRSAIVSLTTEKRLPAVWSDKQFVLDGGLMSYGADVADLFRRSAGYVDRILKGAKPADLPVEQPTKFVLAINLKTAKQLGLTIPQSLLLRADEVIQ